mmetsp:Transcript_2774/g.9375  ORF Transcript_2774/g.9375 Transcript_2774/m.9375 type:complete len:117 (-) Transcript_2774:894-1244(-)
MTDVSNSGDACEQYKSDLLALLMLNETKEQWLRVVVQKLPVYGCLFVRDDKGTAINQVGRGIQDGCAEEEEETDADFLASVRSTFRFPKLADMDLSAVPSPVSYCHLASPPHTHTC